MTDQELKELQERNQKRVQETIQKMGTKYLLHPANRITRKKFKRELLRLKKLYSNV
jgi:transposase-like protein